MSITKCETLRAGFHRNCSAAPLRGKALFRRFQPQASSEMPTSPETRPAVPSTASPWLHSRLFVFLCASLALFLLGLFCLPTPARGYVARSVLGLRFQATDSAISSVPSNEQQCQVRDEILSVEQLRTVLASIGPPPQANRENIEPFPAPSEIDFVRQRLTIVPEKSETMGECKLAISYTGLDDKWSVALVDRLATQTIRRLDERAASDAAKATSPDPTAGVVEARQKEQSARRALDDFLTSHFESLSQANRPPAEPAPAKETAAQKSAVPVPRINPKWQLLHDQLNTHTAERDKILLDRTPEHPQAKETAVKIESLKRQLEETPKFIVEEEPAVSAKKSRASSVRPAQFTTADSPPGTGREYERLIGELRQAREERLAAEKDAETLAKTDSRKTSPGAAVVRGRIVANGHVSQTLRQPPSTSRLTLLTLVSIFVGACVAALIRTSPTMPVYSTLAQIEKDLSLPVVGVVSPSSHSAAALSR